MNHVMKLTRRAVLVGSMLGLAQPLVAQHGAAKGGMLERFNSGGVPIVVEVFRSDLSLAQKQPAILMLHGADGLSGHGRYREGARWVASLGYQVFLIHYLDRTSERRASFSTVFRHFDPWMATLRDALDWVASRPDIDPKRIGLVGISLGAALGLAVASRDQRIKAMVNYFGPLPHGVAEHSARLPPTLILHGAADPVVPVANAFAIEALLKEQGVPYEIKVYAGQGHGFHGDAEADAMRRVASFLSQHL